MNNDFYSDHGSAPASPVRKKGALNQPNIISVSLRFILIAALAFLGYTVVKRVGFDMIGTREYIILGVIAVPVILIVIQLIAWALRWVKDERVSELGLHIVRFAVILFAVMIGVFVLLSIDYTNQYKQNVIQELTQQTLAGRIYIQHSIGDRISFNSRSTGELESALDSMLINDGDDSGAAVNAKRNCVLYLFTDGEDVAYDQLGGSFDFISQEDRSIIAASTSPSVKPKDDMELLRRIRNSGTVEFVSTDTGEFTDLAALSTVYTTSGRPVGVLEIRQSNSDLMNVFSFASLELFLRMAAYICLFSFAFYGIMQLNDIALRPKNFDKSRSVLSCGREAARPILFFVTLTAALPLPLLLFSEALRDSVVIPKLPESLDNIAPVFVYALGIGLGYLATRHIGPRLTEMPSNLALGFTALCNFALILLFDWNIMPVVQRYNNYVTILALLFVSGVCYGISFSTIKKYQKQSDCLFGYDKYSYLCSCLGAVTGAILGAIVMDLRSELSVRILMVILSAVTCVMSIILLEDLNTTGMPDYVRKGLSGLSPRVLLAALPAAALLGFDWVYICEFLRGKGYGATSAVFCAVMPVIAFCFGNRLRLRTGATKRAAAFVAIILAAAAYVPLLISHSPVMAAASALVASFSIIFGAAALYSALCKEERSRFMGVFVLLVLISLAAFSYLIDRFITTFSLYPLIYTAAGCAAIGLLYLIISVFVSAGEKKGSKSAAYAGGGAAFSRPEKKPKPEKQPKPVKEKPVKARKEKPAKAEKTEKPEKASKPDKPSPAKETPKTEKPEKPSSGDSAKDAPVYTSAPLPSDDELNSFFQTQPPQSEPPKSDPLHDIPIDDGFASSPVFAETVTPAEDPLIPDEDSVPIILPDDDIIAL